MPKAGRAKASGLDPHSLPAQLQTALAALYGHYQQTYAAWQIAGLPVPPCFIVVCNNTASSKAVYDYIAGYQSPAPADTADTANTAAEGMAARSNLGALPLFSNYAQDGTPLARPRTLLIDSEQLEAGDALDEQSATLPAPKSSNSAAKSWNAAATAKPPKPSATPPCCAKS